MDWPYASVRTHFAGWVATDALETQIGRVREGLRQAGLRDHVDEDEDLGIAPDSHLQSHFFGATPLAVPGATTIRTADLATLMHEGKPVVIDASEGNWTLPGAISLARAGFGGSLQDQVQDRLALLMKTLTGGDLSRPVVTLGINAERWTGYNLALRLVALGYRHVLWYRGGREAWDVAGLAIVPTQSAPWQFAE